MKQQIYNKMAEKKKNQVVAMASQSLDFDVTL